jgi:hypothetical protein
VFDRLWPNRRAIYQSFRRLTCHRQRRDKIYLSAVAGTAMISLSRWDAKVTRPDEFKSTCLPGTNSLCEFCRVVSTLNRGTSPEVIKGRRKLRGERRKVWHHVEVRNDG